MALGRGNIEIDIRGRVDTAGIARQVTAAEKQIRPLSVSLDNKGFRQPLGQISGDLAEFQKSLDASVARTLAFGAAVGVINSVSDGFRAIIESAVEVEKALTDINVILNLNAESLSQFSEQLFDVAANTGQSFQTIAEAAVELSRQGLGAEETLKRINDAMVLTRLSGMDAAKSVETLTAAVNSFGDAALTTTDLVNKLATVDAAFAVSTEDLSNALARSGASAQAAKVDLNELLAAVTSVQQTTARGGSVIGNAFKSIFTRIQRSGVREALEEIGVATTDSAGNIRGALDILQDYAGVYSTLTDSQRAYTDELVAGVFQINNLRALVKDLGSDYSIYSRALDQSNSATDEAVRRNEQLQGTLSSLINEAGVNAKALAATLGELVATPAVENLLNIFNSIAGALKNALNPEEGSSLIKGMFSAIGSFISGPGLIIIGAAFIKLFKFITQQSLKAVGEIFKIGSAANKVADAEAKIGFLLKNNRSLYEAISNEALTHEQREELVLQTIKQQNRAYQQQQGLIGRLARGRSVQSAINTTTKAQGFIPTASKGHVPNFTRKPNKTTQRTKKRDQKLVESKAAGFVPNFANGLEGAIQAEKNAVSNRVGGASTSAKPAVLKNFPMGGGKRQTVVANTDEVIVPKFGGGSGSAIFNQDMIQKFGMPDGAMPVSRGFIPSFAKSFLDDPKSPFQDLLNSYKGVQVNVQKDLSGFGMLSAKGARDNLSVKKKPGFERKEKIELINSIGGSKLKKDDVDFLLSTIGGKKKTNFTNIPSQTIESADPKQIRGKVGALDNMINPYIADAVANVATTVYTKVLGDEVTAQNLVKNVRSSANVDKGIISTGAQGDIFESAIRLGSKESAKGLGRDNRSAIWDFEEKGSISGDLKSLFFPSSSIVKADAKRSGDQTSANEVVEKAYKDTFPEQLKQIYASNWSPLVRAASQMTPSKQKTERKRIGTNLAGGFIPNFITSIPDDAIRPFQASKDLFISPRENDSIKTEKVSILKPGEARLDRGKAGGQRADGKDVFQALIDIEYDRKNIEEFEKISNPIANKLISGDVEWLDKIEKTSSKLIGRNLADPSNIQGIRTQVNNLKLIKQAKKENIKAKDIAAGKNAKDGTKQKTYWEDYETTIKNGKFKDQEFMESGIRDKVKGAIGEYAAAIKQGTTVNTKNSYFDLANGKEVKTKRITPASNLLKKGANEYLKSLSEKNNLFNQRTDNKKLNKITVIMPRDSKVNFQAADGFIPNFVGDRISWKIDKSKGDYSIAGNNLKLGGFSEYLNKISQKDPKIVSPKSAATFAKRVKEINTQTVKDREEASGKNPIGFGRQGRRHHDAMSGAANKERAVSTKGLFIKDLGKHVKQYNQHGVFGSDKMGDFDSFFAEGYVPSFANQVFDKDKIEPQVAGEILENILVNRKKKDLFIGPSGVGKSTLAAKYGEFIKSLEDAQEATSYTILSGAGKVKSGGMSPALQKIINSVNKSGGRVSYLSASDKTIEERRQKRVGNPLKGDLRSEGQLKGTKYAPKNQPDFIDAIKRAANRFQIINAAEGVVPNFALSQSMLEGLRAKLRPGSGATEAEKKNARKILDKEDKRGSISNIKDAAIIDDLKFSKKQVQGAVADVADKRNSLELDPEPIVIDQRDAIRFAEEYIKKVNKAKRSFTNEKIFGTPLNTNEISMSLKGQGGYERGKYIPKRFQNMADGYIPNFANSLSDAIEREKSVLKDQGSSAKVYVDEDKRLKGPKNPMGLLVANRRDEPTGGFQGVNRAISTGLDPKTHGMASGYIPNFISGGGISKTGFDSAAFKKQQQATQELAASADKAAGNLKNQTEGNEGVSESAGSSFGKMIAIQIALSTVESTLVQTGAVAEDFSLKFTQLGFAVGEGMDSIGDAFEGIGLKGAGKAIKKFAGILGVAAAGAGIAYDMYRNFIDAEMLAIRTLNQEIKTREKSINVIAQNIEAIDQFATSASRFSKAAETGNVESAGKFMQELFSKAKDLGELDTKAFEEVINSLGDAQKLNAAIDAFKKTAAAGKDLKVVENDFAKMVKSFKESIDENQLFGAFGDETGAGVDTTQFEDQFKSLGTTLTKNLSDEKIVSLASALKGFDTSAGNSGQAMLRLQSIFGEFDDSTKTLFASNERLTAGVLDQIKKQSLYSAAIIKAKEAFEIAQSPITVLNKNLNELANGLIAAAQSAEVAINTLAQTGKIQAESNLKTLQASSTTTQSDLLSGKASADIQNSVIQAAKKQEIALKGFAGQMIKESKSGTTTLTGGVKTLIEGINNGSVTNEAALKGLMEIQKTGSPEQKDAAAKTIESLKKINQDQIKDTSVISANLRAQLAAIKSQVVDFQRNTQLNDNQLKILANFDQALKEGNQAGLQVAKSTLERIGELNQAISTIESLGGDQDILAELKESNAQLSQLENLKAAFENLTGESFDAGSLNQLMTQAMDFSVVGLDKEVSSLFTALKAGLQTAIDSTEDAGVKDSADITEASLVKFDESEITALSNAMSEAVSSSLSSALGIGPELASEINKAIDVDLIARGLEKLSIENAENTVKNAQVQKDLNNALISSLKEANFGGASTSLESAAKSLNEAADKIKASYSAEGFVPNYAPVSPVSKALQTERAMGAKKPVIDSHPSIGTYVRDGATQPNFAAVKRDHPEGISKASQNSRAIQSATKASGFIPNFASFYVNDAYNKLGGNLKGIDSGTPSSDLRIARLDKAILNKKGDFSSYFDGWSASKIADEFEAQPLESLFASIPGVGSVLSFAGIKDINAEDVTKQSPPSLKRTYFRYAANESDPNDYPAVIDVGYLYERAKKAFSPQSVQEAINEKINNHDPYSQSGSLDDINPDAHEQYITKEIYERLKSKSSDYEKEFAGRGDKVVAPVGQKYLAGNWWNNSDRRGMFYKNAGVPIEQVDGLKRNALDAYNLPYSGDTISNTFDKLKEIYETGHVKAKGYAWADSFKAKYGFIRKRSSEFDDSKLKNLILGQAIKSHDSDTILGVAEGPEFLLRKQIEGGLRGIHLGLINSSQGIDIPFGITENGFVSDDIIGNYTFDEFARLGDSIRQRITDEKARDNDVIEGTSPNEELIKNYQDQLKKYQEKLKFFNKNIYSRDTEDFVTAPGYFDLRSKEGKVIDSGNADKWVDFPTTRFNYKQNLGDISEPAEPKKKPEQRFINFQNQLVGKLNSAENIADVMPYLKERYAEGTKEALFNLQQKRGQQRYSSVIELIKKRQVTVKEEIDQLEKKEKRTPEEEIRLKNLKGKGDLIKTTGQEQGPLQPGQKRGEGVLADLEAEQTEFTGNRSTAQTAAEQGLEVEEVKLQTDGEKERNKLYTALLGKEIEQARESDGSQQFLDQINKVKGFRSDYVNYIDKLIEGRRRAIDSEKRFTSSNSIIKQSEAAINTLNSLKSIYSDDQLAAAYHLDVAHNWGNSHVPIGGEYTMPVEGIANMMWNPVNSNWLELFNKEKAKYGIDNFTADQSLGGKQNRAKILSNYQGRGLLNDPNLGLYAKIQKTEGNQPNRFLEEFSFADVGNRKNMLERIGANLTDPATDEDLRGLGIEDILRNFATSARDDKLAFLFKELNKSGDDYSAFRKYFVDKVQEMGIPFNHLKSIGGILKEKKIDVLSDKANSVSVPAVDDSSLNSLISELINIQVRDYNDIPEGQKTPSVFETLAGSINEDQLLNYPVYLNHLIESQQASRVKNKIVNMLENPEGIDTQIWAKKYKGNLGLLNKFGGESYRKTGDLNISAALKKIGIEDPNKKFAPDGKNHFDISNDNENITPTESVEKIISGKYHAINPGIEKLFSTDEHPLNTISLPDEISNNVTFDSSGALEELKKKFKILQKTTEGNVKNYAPYGYELEGGFKRETPAGQPHLVEPLNDAINNASTQKSREEKLQNELNEAAKGFVPNFSAVAGEISASRVAGYQDPVTPSQVKTMSVPGAGKMAYNTQESVFSMPGVSQPFIAPPSNSKAAKPYAKEVEKKYNFNPYKKTAADGFVPNFQRGMDFNSFQTAVSAFENVIGGFERHVSSFGESIRSLNFQQFASASKEIHKAAETFSAQSSVFKDAADAIQKGADSLGNQTIEVPTLNFSELTSAASEFSASATKLASKGIDVNAESVIDSVNSLSTALSQVQGTIDVKIPDVTVNVQGNVSAAVRSALQAEVPNAINSALANIDMGRIATEAVNAKLGIG